MSNSAIRIPIAGSIINAPSAESGDMLFFDPLAGAGGSFVNFKPLVTDMRPFTKNGRLDFYVSVKDKTEATIWDNAVSLGATLLAHEVDGEFVTNDIRFGVNLNGDVPTSTMEIGGDLFSWGRGNIGGGFVGVMSYYTGVTSLPGPSFENLIFATPTKSHTEAELDAIASDLRQGDLLIRNSTTKNTFFGKLEHFAVAGNGVSITGNTIEIAPLSSITSNAGITVRIDADANTREDQFKVVETLDTGDYNLLSLTRTHGTGLTWNATTNAFEYGTAANETWPVVRFGVGTGARAIPSGFVMEDGVPVTASSPDLLETDAASFSTHQARLFGPVANKPHEIIITGTAGDTSSANYFDTRTNTSCFAITGGRFNMLMGVSGMGGGIANPGSFVASFLSKHNDSGGVKIKTGDTNNEEFALFIESGGVTGFAGTSGSSADLSARNLAILVDDTSGAANAQYKNIVAADAPVFTVRASSGDTFIRGFLNLPFMPGLNSIWDGVIAGDGSISQPSLNGDGWNGGIVPPTGFAFNGIYKNQSGEVFARRYQKIEISPGNPAWQLVASFTLPKGTMYSTVDGTVKIVKSGVVYPNHGLNGVSNWTLSD